MKILCNCTTLVMGGALQASLSFIIRALNDNSINWSFIVSNELANQLASAGIDCSGDDRFHVLTASPAKSIISRRKLLSYESNIQPDAIFTFFGPAYVRFKTRHFMGFAVPWVTHPNNYAWAAVPTLIEKIRLYLNVRYKLKWLKFADYWIVEAEVAKNGIVKLLSVDSDKIGVVKNSCRDEYRKISTKGMDANQNDEIHILYISAYYIHKNFEIIPYVAKEMATRRPELKFKFILTIPKNNAASIKIMKMADELDVGHCINVIGAVAVMDAVKLYESSHIAFIPTLLETFSATYPEAMAAGLPIVASDFDFARNVCEDAALYFAPDSPSDAAENILKIVDQSELRDNLIARGKLVVAGLPSADDKYDAYKQYILDRMA